MLHLDVLLQEEAFEKLLHKEAELGCALLHREREKHNQLTEYMAKTAESYETELNARNTELMLIRFDRDRIQSLLNNIEKRLNNTSSCRHCGIDFNCIFRTGESLLRLGKCNTRHYL